MLNKFPNLTHTCPCLPPPGEYGLRSQGQLHLRQPGDVLLPQPQLLQEGQDALRRGKVGVGQRRCAQRLCAGDARLRGCLRLCACPRAQREEIGSQGVILFPSLMQPGTSFARKPLESCLPCPILVNGTFFDFFFREELTRQCDSGDGHYFLLLFSSSFCFPCPFSFWFLVVLPSNVFILQKDELTRIACAKLQLLEEARPYLQVETI